MTTVKRTLFSICHFDISAVDAAPIAAFYQSMFGWTVTPRGPGYAQIETPGGLRGAIAETPNPGFTFGIAVPDLDDALARVVKEGGAVVMPATDNGWVRKGQVSDPAGNVLTLIQG